MNTTKLTTIATLLFLGSQTAGAETTPAWMEEGFVMEEVVVTAEAPAHLFMEEIVVTAQAPAHLSMEEIVVTAQAPAHLYMEEIVVTAQAPEHLYIEEIVVTASRQELRDRMLARLRIMRPSLFDRG